MFEKICPECGEKFGGRSDKKFCSDYCRNAYNHKQNLDNSPIVKRINKALKKNRSILKSLTPNDKSKASKMKMIQLGFDFNYHTSIYTTTKGSVYNFCYEYGYLELENDWLLLIKDKFNEEL